MMPGPLCLLLSAASADTMLWSMLLVVVSAKLLAEAAERLNQPAVVGELMAGIVIGPAVLGWVKPDDFLAALSELGVLFLLFRVGLELEDFQPAKLGFTAAVVAVCGVVVPFGMGWAIMWAFGEPRLETIFVAAAMVATSVGITAKVLAEKGLLQETSSKIILAAAVIDDVLGLLVLAVVSSVARGRVNLVELVSTAALAVGFTVVVAQWGKPAMDRMLPRVQARLRGSDSDFTLALVLLFGLSLLASFTGVAAIVGAFLAGMALTSSVNRGVHDRMSGVTGLLVPFFLVGIGLHMDLSALREPRYLLIGVVILAAACISKFIGCGLGAYRQGRKEAVRIGVGMIPRGEVGLVVAQIGLGMKVIPPPIYSVVVFMSIATTLIAPPLLKLAYRGVAARGEPETDLPEVG